MYIRKLFDTDISHHFDYKISFVNSQQENTNLKGDFVPKKIGLKRSFRFLVYKNKSKIEIYIIIPIALPQFNMVLIELLSIFKALFLF